MTNRIEEDLVSVIVINKNHGQFIGEALRSISSQSHKKIEVIVVDGFSTDNSFDEIQKFRSSLKMQIVRKKDAGSSQAIIRGINLVKGEYFVVTTSTDGFLDKKWLETGVRVLKRDRSLAGVQGRIAIVEEDGLDTKKRYQSWFQSSLSPGAFFCHWLIRGIPILETTCIWRTADVRHLVPKEIYYSRNNDLLSKDCIYELKFNVMSELKLIKPTMNVAGFVRNHSIRLSTMRDASKLSFRYQSDYITKVKEYRKTLFRNPTFHLVSLKQRLGHSNMSFIKTLFDFLIHFPVAICILLGRKLKLSLKSN